MPGSGVIVLPVVNPAEITSLGRSCTRCECWSMTRATKHHPGTRSCTRWRRRHAAGCVRSARPPLIPWKPGSCSGTFCKTNGRPRSACLNNAQCALLLPHAQLGKSDDGDRIPQQKPSAGSIHRPPISPMYQARERSYSSDVFLMKDLPLQSVQNEPTATWRFRLGGQGLSRHKIPQSKCDRLSVGV